MRTKTITEPQMIHRFFNAETGQHITESEAKKLPPGSVLVESIRIPHKYISAYNDASLTKPALNVVKERQVTAHHWLTHFVGYFVTRFKRAFVVAHGAKKEQPLFEVHKSF